MILPKYENFNHLQVDFYLTFKHDSETYQNITDFLKRIYKKYGCFHFETLLNSGILNSWALSAHKQYNKKFGVLPLSVADRRDVFKLIVYDWAVDILEDSGKTEKITVCVLSFNAGRFAENYAQYITDKWGDFYENFYFSLFCPASVVSEIKELKEEGINIL